MYCPGTASMAAVRLPGSGDCCAGFDRVSHPASAARNARATMRAADGMAYPSVERLTHGGGEKSVPNPSRERGADGSQQAFAVVRAGPVRNRKSVGKGRRGELGVRGV